MSLYLLLDFAAISIPFAFSFEKRLEFYKLWRGLFLSIATIGFVFILWDGAFTRMGVWGFNPEYLSGIFFCGLPLEEYLFFICVPYAGVFTFHVFRTLLPRFTISPGMLRLITLIAAIPLTLAGIIFYDRWYTCSTFLFATLSLFAAHVWFRELLPHFLLSFCAILLPFMIMNGILTGTFIEGEVVWYNDAENLGIRVLTIPLEDFFYGLSLLLWNVNLTITLLKKISRNR
jgi:lycopene cyclase domain-containing protein